MQQKPPAPTPSASQSNIGQLRMGGAEWALLFLHAMLWGSSYFFIAVAKNELPVFTITSLRMVPAVLVIVTIIWIAGYRLPSTWREWGPFIPLSLLNNYLPFCLIVYAQHQVTGGIAAVFCATTPLFGMFMAHVLTRDEKLSANKLAGVVIGIGGVAILALPDLMAGTADALWAKLALLGAALLYASGGIYARGFSRYPPMVLSGAHMSMTLVLSLPAMLIIDRPWTLPMPSWPVIASVAGTGIFASALASIIFFTLIKRAGATNALLVTLLLPVTPMVLGYLLLGERMSGRELAGAAVIGLALLVIDGRLVRRLLGEKH